MGKMKFRAACAALAAILVAVPAGLVLRAKVESAARAGVAHSVAYSALR